MISEFQARRPLYEEFLASLLNDLLLLMNRQELENIRDKNQMREEMEQAVSYFNEHYQKPINIEEYAASRHMSAEWFIRRFKRTMNLTPAQYLLSLRISNAQNLLEHSDYNISEIASIVGYESPLYFSRVFKKRLGVSPSQYREQLSDNRTESAEETTEESG